jgi:hypothetical protein
LDITGVGCCSIMICSRSVPFDKLRVNLQQAMIVALQLAT